MRFDPIQARFPFPAGGYESFYLTAHHPAEPLAVWIRCTVTQAPGMPPVGHRWVTLFEPHGATRIRTAGSPTTDGAWIRVGDAAFLDGVAGGSADGVSWELRFSALDQPLFYLPSERMYRGGFPRTKPVSLVPDAKFSGSLLFGDRVVDVRNWTGMVGHNWGREHADRWVWLHANFGGESWFDVVAARIKLGPVRTPWIANGAVSIRGGRHRLGGIRRRARVEAGPSGVDLSVRGGDMRVHAVAAAPSERFAGWDYAHPSGDGASDVRHCSIASLEVDCTPKAGVPVRLRSEFGGACEVGTRRG